MPKHSPSQWSISEFYKQAWQLTMKHKKLWILGFAVAMFASGGGNSRLNLPNSRDTEKTEQQQVKQVETVKNTYNIREDENLDLTETKRELKDTPVKTAVDAMEKEEESPLVDVIFAGFSRVPWQYYALFTLECIGIILFSVVLFFIVSHWAKAAMMVGVNRAAHDKKVDLFEISRDAFKPVKSLIWLSILPRLGLVLGIIVGFIGIGILTAILPPVGFIAMIIGFFFLVYVLFRFTIGMIWAERYIVLDNKSGKDGFSAGYASAKGFLWKGLRLGIANTLSIMLINLLLLLPLIGVSIASFVPLFRSEERHFTPTMLILPILFAVITIPVMMLVSAVSSVFRYATWQYGFDFMKAQQEK